MCHVFFAQLSHPNEFPRPDLNPTYHFFLQVFDDICSELAMAILQFFGGKPSEEHVFRCMKALAKFCQISHREVPQLIKMIGPEPSKFSGLSARVDGLIEAVNAKLATVPMF